MNEVLGRENRVVWLLIDVVVWRNRHFLVDYSEMRVERRNVADEACLPDAPRPLGRSCEAEVAAAAATELDMAGLAAQDR